jgi:hypothetical protein
MTTTDKQFRQYLKQADHDDQMVGGMAEYLYNYWPCWSTFWLVVACTGSLW